MNESSVTQNRKKRKISDALDESPMTYFGRVHMQNNDLATASNESPVTFRRNVTGLSLVRRSAFVFSGLAYRPAPPMAACRSAAARFFGRVEGREPRDREHCSWPSTRCWADRQACGRAGAELASQGR